MPSNGSCPGGSVTSEVREEVAASWARAVPFGLRLDRLDSPWDPDLDSGGRPAKAARPVLDKIGGDLVGTGMSLLLTDERGHVLQRRVTDRGLRAQLDRILLVPGFSYGEEHTGTNAIGTTLDRRRPTVVEGGEHFAEALTIMACAAAPIRDPGAGEVVGIVDLTCSAEDASRLMLPLANQVPRQIEEHLLQGRSPEERLLHGHFVRARRRVKGPLGSLNEQTMMTNAAAAGIVRPDRPLLWEWVSRRLAEGTLVASELLLTNGVAVLGRCEAIREGGMVVDAHVRLKPPASGSGRRPVSGWASLTEAERSVAALVAKGWTNREAAARLFCSPHTVDSHLRSSYGKARRHLTGLPRPPGASPVGLSPVHDVSTPCTTVRNIMWWTCKVFPAAHVTSVPF